MKILIIHPKFYIYGGAEILIVRLCNYLNDRGVETAILTTHMEQSIGKDLINTRIILEPSKKPENTRRFGTILKYEISAIKSGLKKIAGEYDVINPHNLPSEIAAMSCKKPIVWMCNEPELSITINSGQIGIFSLESVYLQWLLLLEKLLLKKRIKFAVVADKVNAARFSHIYGFDPVTINYGIDYDFFAERIVPDRLEKARYRGRFVILHVGMMNTFKNQIASIRAVEELKPHIPEICLVFAGGGNDECYLKKLKDYISAHSLDDVVEFRGHIDRNKLRELYSLSNLMLHPILSQGGWLSPFEMLCAGKPIIVSEDMTASEIISTNGLGIATSRYADAIMDVYQNPARHVKMAEKGKRFVRENLSWSHYGDGMLDVFKKAAV